jgi:beta-mannosidase
MPRCAPATCLCQTDHTSSLHTVPLSQAGSASCPTHAQGANLIPLDVLHTRATPAAVHQLLRQALLAHMNMIRVWCVCASHLVSPLLVPSTIPTGTPRVVAMACLVRNWSCTTHCCRGGGRYQIDALYEFCDQHGLLVWQELMYACAPYPMLPDLLQEVRGAR